jgi:hypothetical protein
VILAPFWFALPTPTLEMTGGVVSAERVIATLLKVLVESTELLWLVTAKPTWTVDPIGSDAEPAVVHSEPFTDPSAVNVSPARTSRNQCGAVPEPALLYSLIPLVWDREVSDKP